MMTTKNRIKTIVTLAAVAMAVMATSANAGITLDGSASWDSGINNSWTEPFSASGADKLVVVVTGEHHFNNADGNVNSITYRGQDLIQAVNRDPIEAGTDTTANDIWYLDAPDSYVGTDEVAVSFSGKNWVVTALRLSGAADGVSATAVSDPGSKSVDLTALGSGSFVVAVIGMGGSGNTADVGNVDADAPAIELSALEIGNNWAGHVTSYTTGVSTGTSTYSFTGGNETGVNTIAAAFEDAYADPNLPSVDAGDNMISWSGALVALDPTVVEAPGSDWTSLTYLWTASPDGIGDPNLDVVITGAATENASVTVTKAEPTGDATIVTMTLAVNNAGNLPEEAVTDSMTIEIYDDSCLAAQAVGPVTFDPTDIDQNCITAFPDFALMALTWFEDYTLTEAVPK